MHVLSREFSQKPESKPQPYKPSPFLVFALSCIERSLSSLSSLKMRCAIFFAALVAVGSAIPQLSVRQTALTGVEYPGERQCSPTGQKW